MGPRFLIVDDDPTVREVLSEILTSFDCEVDQAENGNQALGKIVLHHKRQPYDAVFLDLVMPGINGYEVLKRIKTTEFSKDLPVIMLTAADEGELMIEAYRNGADYYIPKPFNANQIIYCLDLLLGDGDSAQEVSPDGQASTENTSSQGKPSEDPTSPDQSH
jgi:DNA-binding response OmpR family regulator